MSTIVKFKQLSEYINIKTFADKADINYNTMYSKLRNGTDLSEQQAKGIKSVTKELITLLKQLEEEI